MEKPTIVVIEDDGPAVSVLEMELEYGYEMDFSNPNGESPVKLMHLQSLGELAELNSINPIQILGIALDDSFPTGVLNPDFEIPQLENDAQNGQRALAWLTGTLGIDPEKIWGTSGNKEGQPYLSESQQLGKDYQRFAKIMAEKFEKLQES